MKQVKRVLVAGSGTAGLVAAIVLKTRLDIKVDVISSGKIGIIGVGEGSTEHFKEFMDFAGIDQYDLIKNTDATYKAGIMFEGWSDSTFLHSVAYPFDIKLGQYNAVYGNQISKNLKYITPKYTWNSKISSNFLGNPSLFPYNQFHFDTHKLNDYLIKISKSKGIEFFEDEIKDVLINSIGDIESIVGNNKTYKYDFFIDATGFNRILINKLGGKWKSYQDFLKLNSAITFETKDAGDIDAWTLSKTMDAGWMFRIPVWSRQGNGYIFDSNYISKEAAQQEVENLFQRPIEIGKQISFDPGCLENAWIKNCCAIGLSGSFFEPLEASSIGTSIQQSFLLMHNLVNYNESIIKSYNESFQGIVENIRDFIVLHYITKKNNSNFWKDLQHQKIPESLQNKLDMWKCRLPINEDFKKSSDYCLFTAHNFTLIMDGLQLLNIDSVKSEYESQNLKVKSACDRIIEDCLLNENGSFISHRDMLNFIRNS